MNTATLSSLRPPRADALARAPERRLPADADTLLRERVLEQLRHVPGWQAERSNVHVDGGLVVLQGLVRNDAARLPGRRAAEAVPGVQRVWDARVREREWQALA